MEKAASILSKNKLEGKKILINWDSQSAIQSIDSTVIRNKSTESALNALNLLGGTNEVTLRWIPAHSGYEGNELADDQRTTVLLVPFFRCRVVFAIRH